jgi:adenosyl cobinamide kinase/adenosyl cobinamide phosphate guanylyltransferase/NaMN:DMB phosphoribosyltransferase
MAGGKVLVLGGIRSGKSEFAEGLFASVDQVRYVATAGEADDDFAERIEAHRFRRPASWETVEAVGDPTVLLEALGKADPLWPMLVDDLGGWAAALLGRDDAGQLVTQLAETVRHCAARVVLVSPEVGLSVVPPTEVGVEFADLVGSLNKAVAEACDEVALIVAGQPTWLKHGPGRPGQPIFNAPPAVTPPIVVTDAPADTRDMAALREQTRPLPIVETKFEVRPGMDLPIHNEQARSEAEAHLSNLDILGTGLGDLARLVIFSAGTQGRAVPTPWQQPQLLLVRGAHEGDLAAGDDIAEATRTAEAAKRGEGAIGILAAQASVDVRVVQAPVAGDIAYGRTTEPDLISLMLRTGWAMADEAVDSGVDLLMVGSVSPGAEATAAVVTARITGAEIAGLLARVVGADGAIDDTAWMLRAAAARDALHRTRHVSLNADTLLEEIAGPDFALIAGVILGATARRTAVMLDGPVGVAAALLARDIGSQSRLWCLLPDHGGHPTTKTAADVLGLEPLLDLKVGLGEGATSLLAFPLLRNTLLLAANLPTNPPILSAPPGFEDEDVAP